MRRILGLATGLAVAMFLPGLLVACGEKSPDEPISATPGPPTAPSGSLLHDARLDLAQRLRIDATKVTLKETRAAGWDGCLGVAVPGQACAQLFVGGYIGFFDAGGRTYRYHFGGARFIATDFVKGTVSDGSPVPPELLPDFSALLAAYARFDLGLRLGKPGAALIIQWIVPTTFTNTCLDIAGAQGCSASSVQGAIVGVADGAVLHAYHVGMRGGVAYLGQGAISPVEPADAPAARAAQLAMRQDLSKRLGVSPETISVVTFHRVTWSDGCIGVYAPGQICTQALVQGYFALLADSAGLQYEYHGADSGFIAATFERGSTVRQPTITQGR